MAGDEPCFICGNVGCSGLHGNRWGMLGPPPWSQPVLPIGRPYDGAVVDKHGSLVIPSPPQQKAGDANPT